MMNMNMNQAMLINQANQFLGNNILNPQQQQQRWMDKPDGDPSGLSYLKPLDSLLAKQVVSMTECKRFSNHQSLDCKEISLHLCLVMVGIPSQAKIWDIQ